jgi:hypothetical protein
MIEVLKTTHRLNIVPLVLRVIEKLGQARDGPLGIVIRMAVIDDWRAVRRALHLVLLEVTD